LIWIILYYPSILMPLNFWFQLTNLKFNFWGDIERYLSLLSLCYNEKHRWISNSNSDILWISLISWISRNFRNWHNFCCDKKRQTYQSIAWDLLRSHLLNFRILWSFRIILAYGDAWIMSYNHMCIMKILVKVVEIKS